MDALKKLGSVGVLTVLLILLLLFGQNVVNLILQLVVLIALVYALADKYPAKADQFWKWSKTGAIVLILLCVFRMVSDKERGELPHRFNYGHRLWKEAVTTLAQQVAEHSHTPDEAMDYLIVFVDHMQDVVFAKEIRTKLALATDAFAKGDSLNGYLYTEQAVARLIESRDFPKRVYDQLHGKGSPSIGDTGKKAPNVAVAVGGWIWNRVTLSHNGTSDLAQALEMAQDVLFWVLIVCIVLIWTKRTFPWIRGTTIVVSLNLIFAMGGVWAMNLAIQRGLNPYIGVAAWGLAVIAATAAFGLMSAQLKVESNRKIFYGIVVEFLAVIVLFNLTATNAERTTFDTMSAEARPLVKVERAADGTIVGVWPAYKKRSPTGVLLENPKPGEVLPEKVQRDPGLGTMISRWLDQQGTSLSTMTREQAHARKVTCAGIIAVVMLLFAVGFLIRGPKLAALIPIILMVYALQAAAGL